MHIAVAGASFSPDNRAFEIYVSGCTHNCAGCHNPELQAYGVGKSWLKWYRLNKHNLKNSLVERIWVLGGDLMCQEIPAYLDMVHDLKSTGKELWLWTGKELDEIPKGYDVLKHFDYIKTGRYQANKPAYVVPVNRMTITLASANQKIYDVKRGTYVS